MKKYKNIESKVVPFIFYIAIIVVWQVYVKCTSVDVYILPSPVDIIKSTVEILPDIRPHVVATLIEAFLGLAVSIILAVIIALLIDISKTFKRVVYPLILFSQTVPIVSLAPLFMLWFGFGITPKIVVVIMVCFFPIIINLIEGMESIDKDLINLLKSMGANKFQIFKLVKFPASMVSFFSGLRLSVTYSIMGAVIGEWLGGNEGIGVYMIRAKRSFDADKVFSASLIIVILSFLLFYIITQIQKRLMPWND